MSRQAMLTGSCITDSGYSGNSNWSKQSHASEDNLGTIAGYSIREIFNATFETIAYNKAYSLADIDVSSILQSIASLGIDAFVDLISQGLESIIEQTINSNDILKTLYTMLNKDLTTLLGEAIEKAISEVITEALNILLDAIVNVISDLVVDVITEVIVGAINTVFMGIPVGSIAKPIVHALVESVTNIILTTVGNSFIQAVSSGISGSISNLITNAISETGLFQWINNYYEQFRELVNPQTWINALKSAATDVLNKIFDDLLGDLDWYVSLGQYIQKTLSYDSDDHTSTLNWTLATTMCSRSMDLFVDYGKGVTKTGVLGMVQKLYTWGTTKSDFVMILPAQSYLQHINLGLVPREQGDLELTKDVVSAYVTINRNETTYTYELGAEDLYNQDYRIKAPYQLKIYYEDYVYRTVNYGSTISGILGGESNDLQITLTYKVTVTNSSSQYVAYLREIVDYYVSSLTLVRAYDADGNELTVSTNQDGSSLTSFYNKASNYDVTSYGYYTAFVSGDSFRSSIGNSLNPGESVDIYLEYTVNKDSNGGIILDGSGENEGKINIAEVGAFSFYTSDGSKPAGVVDGDSNPASLKGENLTDESKYEDDTYLTNIQISLREDPGNPSDTPDPEPDTDPDPDPPENVDPDPGDDTLYRCISGNVWEDWATESSATSTGQKIGNGIRDPEEEGVEGILVVLLEVVTDGDDEYIVYSGITTKTDENGDYYLYDPTRLHAGEYIIRFIYGDDSSAMTTDDGGDTIKFSGQDYKSAIYTDVDTTIIEPEPVETSAYIDTYNALGEVSTARDNEVRRLEVIAYSITMTYELDNALKTINDELAENTYMYADTRNFMIRIENEYEDADLFILPGMKDGVVEFNTIYYVAREINFGIITRPQTKLVTAKDISELIATTSDGTVLVDLVFDVYYYVVDEEFKHVSVLNETSSTGYKNVQILNRSSGNQGFRYVNVDSELLQGMTVTITYQIGVGNMSEIDTEYENLLLMAKNYDVDNVAYDLKSYLGNFADTTYRYNSSITTTNELLLSVTNNNLDNIIADFIRDYNSQGYTNGTSYTSGYFVGGTYYTGIVGSEVVVQTRVDQVLDYIDNDLIFDITENTDENGNGKFVTYTASEIGEYKLLKGITPASSNAEITDGKQTYITEDGNGNIIKNNLAFSIEDEAINPLLYKYVEPLSSNNVTNPTTAATYIDVSDDDDTSETGGTVNVEANETETTVTDNQGNVVYPYDEQYIYEIEITASRTLTSEEEIDGFTLDNIAEIVKISNTVGRKVYIENGDDTVSAKIGNSIDTVKLMYDDTSTVTIEDVVAESDTDYTEYVTFSPPTGVTGKQQMIENVVKGVSVVVIVAAAAALVVIIRVVIKNKKRFYR